MITIKVKFYCNAGHTEETLYIEIDDDGNIEEQINEEFLKWLDNNEDCGWEQIDENGMIIRN